MKKALQSGVEYRTKANKRLEKYRDKMRERGYRSFSVYLHQNDLDFLKEIKETSNFETNEDVVGYILSTFRYLHKSRQKIGKITNHLQGNI